MDAKVEMLGNQSKWKNKLFTAKLPYCHPARRRVALTNVELVIFFVCFVPFASQFG